MCNNIGYLDVSETVEFNSHDVQLKETRKT